MDGDYDGVSLAAFRDGGGHRRVEFVQWSGPDPGVTGRVVDLDEEDRVKALVCVGPKRLPLRLREMDLRMIWRDTGARHVKAGWKRNQNQSRVAPHLLSLRDMWRVVECPDTVEPDLCCFLCGATQTNQIPIENARRCCLCLLCTHTACALRLAPSLQAQVARANRLEHEQREPLADESLTPIIPSVPPEGLCIPDEFTHSSRQAG